MKISGLRVVGSVVLVLMLSSIVATSALAAPGTPTPPGTTSGGTGYGMIGGYNLNGVAKLLGVKTSDIVSQLRQGKTLVEIAGDKATAGQLVDTLIGPYKDELQLRVKYEDISQDQADTLLHSATDRAKTFVNTARNTGSDSSGSFGGMMGGYGGGMMGGFGDDFGGWMGGLANMMSGLGGKMGGFGGSGGMMGGAGRGGMMGGRGR